MTTAAKTNQLEMVKKRKVVLKTKFTKMSSNTLLRKISLGKMNHEEASVSAHIIERRFPNPPGISNYRLITAFRVRDN
jgi:hypothetical protein